ncbi:MAG: hypothetical protein AVDCRST_MAG59-2928, partial [uncultured Thermomicrobiales bacterium]
EGAGVVWRPVVSATSCPPRDLGRPEAATGPRIPTATCSPRERTPLLRRRVPCRRL